MVAAYGVACDLLRRWQDRPRLRRERFGRHYTCSSTSTAGYGHMYGHRWILPSHVPAHTHTHAHVARTGTRATKKVLDACITALRGHAERARRVSRVAAAQASLKRDDRYERVSHSTLDPAAALPLGCGGPSLPCHIPVATEVCQTPTVSRSRSVDRQSSKGYGTHTRCSAQATSAHTHTQ